jgi:hypothetical protein
MMRSPNRWVALLFGAGYIALGATSFAVTAGMGLTATPGSLLLGLIEVNPLGAVVHLAIGAALLVTGIVGVRPARTANAIVGTACLVLGMTGLFVVGTELNLLALNGVGNVLHFGSAVLLLAVGAGAERTTRIA